MDGTINIKIPTEQNYDQLMIFNQEQFEEFVDLVSNQGKKEIGAFILEVTETSVILYKDAGFHKETWTGPNYVMARSDAKTAIKAIENARVKKIIENRYVFLDCNKGCWKSGDETLAISEMDANHITNCINMIHEKCLPFTKSHRYKTEIDHLLNTKLQELQSEEVARKT